MPKKVNPETNTEESVLTNESARPETSIDNGETGFAPEYDPNYEPLSLPEQADTFRSDQNPIYSAADPTQHTQQSPSSQQSQGGPSANRQQNNGFSSQDGDNQAAQTGYRTWGQTMQTQSNPMQDQQRMNSVQFGAARQQGGNYLPMLNLGDAKRLASLLGGTWLAIYGLSRSLGSLTLAGAGLGLLYYAMTGRWPLAGQTGETRTNQGGRSMSTVKPISAMHSSTDSSMTTKNIIVKAPLHEVYQAWANFENFPNFMQHIKSVRKTGDRTSHWTMEGPLNTQIEWDAETTRLDEDKRIAWSSITGDIKTSGQVTFNQLPNDEVEVTVMLKYVPPAGLAGNMVAELFSNPEGKLLEDLRNFKRTIEQRQPQPA
ncbi:MAG: SRPBCC family protein [Caldilineaceae bacterium]